MNFFESLILNGILIGFPILCFLFYASVGKYIDSINKNMALTFAIIFSFFLTLKYGSDNNLILNLLLLNIPIFIAYLKKYVFLANALIIMLLYIYNLNFEYSSLIIVAYIFINLLYFIKTKFDIKNSLYMSLYSIIVLFFFFILLYVCNSQLLTNTLFYMLVFDTLLNITYCLLTKSEEIMQSHQEYLELQQEKQIRLSLFKITHEIKNPIAVCKAYLDMFNINKKDHAKRYVPILKSEINRLLILLEDFLLVNKVNIQCDIMDANLMISDVASSMFCLLNDNNVNLNLDITDDEIFINGDYNKLSQVLINVIKNSVEANTSNIWITLSSKNANLEINIKDDGDGIPKDLIHKIKEPFYTTKCRGTGLGVALSYEIITAHNGTIDYNSIYGRGTNVKIVLPLYDI